MTSVPKPLKFLRPLYPDMVTIHDSWSETADKVQRSGFGLQDEQVDEIDWIKHPNMLYVYMPF
jgi:hypothetical protein